MKGFFVNNETILTHERCDATQLDWVYFDRVLSEQAHQMTWWTSVESRSRRFLHSAATPPCTSAGTVTPASVWRTLSAPLTTPFLATFSASSRTAMVGRNYGSCSPIFVYFSTKLSRYVEDYFFRVWKYAGMLLILSGMFLSYLKKCPYETVSLISTVWSMYDIFLQVLDSFLCTLTVIVNSFWETDLCFHYVIFLIWIC